MYFFSLANVDITIEHIGVHRNFVAAVIFLSHQSYILGKIQL